MRDLPCRAVRSLPVTWSVENKRILITGGNSGIGKAAAIALVGLGAHVTLTARDPSKGSGARDDIHIS